MPTRILCLCALLLPVFAASAVEFRQYEGFPEPAPGAFAVVGTALPDGRLLVWDGLSLHQQIMPGGQDFEIVATGFEGDPGFIAISPDSATLILGEGYGGRLYKLDPTNWDDFTPASVVATYSHFGGAFLTNELLLLDASYPDFSGSELVVVDVSGDGPPNPAKVAPVVKAPRRLPAMMAAPGGFELDLVDKPAFSYPANLTADYAEGIVYAMDANARELRFFEISALVAAYEGGGSMDWTAGTLVGAAGQFFSGGVAGITPGGLLIIPGSSGFLQPGGIQVVDPSLSEPAQAAVIEVLDPADNQGYYSAIYNPVLDQIIAFVNGEAYVPEETYLPVPAAGPAALLTMAAALALLGRRRLRKTAC